ncbi:MAG: septum site-determining protein MinC [Azoarcus sp.]|jgi:septum site-determining protein MinC|nr:septum site-determining protein MinC [Azoarcus sp.]
MPSPATARSIEFLHTNLCAVIVSLGRADPAGLADDMHKMFGGQAAPFNQEAAILDFGALAFAQLPDRIDWNGLTSLLRRYRLQPVGVRNLVGGPQTEAAHRAGLAMLDDTQISTGGRNAPQSAPRRAAREVAAPAAAPAAKGPAASGPAASGPAASTLYVDRPVRSGQQIYAQGGDLVLLAGISPGSEVIADGNIHCFGPLAGRALAGARGDVNARVISTCFGPELVAVAGVYRTFEGGMPSMYAGRAVMVRLKPSAKNQSIVIEPLQID